MMTKGMEYIKTDKNGTKYYADYTCPRCGGAGGADQWRYTGWTCYNCGGTGKTDKPSIIKIYTPEYEEKLKAQREKRAEKRRQARLAEIREHMDEVYTSHGFNAEGKLYAVVEPNTYQIKEDLKAAGARWMPGISCWVFTERPENWQTVELRFDEVLQIDEQYGSVNWIEGVDGKAVVLSKVPRPADAPISEYVGEVGKRIELPVKLESIHHWEVPSYVPWEGNTVQTLYKFADADGNVIVWKTTGFGLDARKYPEGISLTLRGTVKEHNEYKGERQTVLTRCKAV